MRGGRQGGFFLRLFFGPVREGMGQLNDVFDVQRARGRRGTGALRAGFQAGGLFKQGVAARILWRRQIAEEIGQRLGRAVCSAFRRGRDGLAQSDNVRGRRRRRLRGLSRTRRGVFSKGDIFPSREREGGVFGRSGWLGQGLAQFQNVTL